MIDRFGTPYTQALHVVERYRSLDYEATRKRRRGRQGMAAAAAIDPNYRGRACSSNSLWSSRRLHMPWSHITYGRDRILIWEETCLPRKCAARLSGAILSDKNGICDCGQPDFLIERRMRHGRPPASSGGLK